MTRPTGDAVRPPAVAAPASARLDWTDRVTLAPEEASLYLDSLCGADGTALPWQPFAVTAVFADPLAEPTSRFDVMGGTAPPAPPGPLASLATSVGIPAVPSRRAPTAAPARTGQIRPAVRVASGSPASTTRSPVAAGAPSAWAPAAALGRTPVAPPARPIAPARAAAVAPARRAATGAVYPGRAAVPVAPAAATGRRPPSAPVARGYGQAGPSARAAAAIPVAVPAPRGTRRPGGPPGTIRTARSAVARRITAGWSLLVLLLVVGSSTGLLPKVVDFLGRFFHR